MASASFQNSAVYALPHLYLQGLQIAPASPNATTIVAVAPGAARDSANVMDMVVGLGNYVGFNEPPLQYLNYQSGLFVDSTINGANGLDSGTIQPSTQYAVYLIGDSRQYNNVAAVLSLPSNTSPTLPRGYDSYRLLGFLGTNGSALFQYLNSEPQNIANIQTYFNNPPINVLSAGNATTFTGINLGNNFAVSSLSLPNLIVTILVTYIPSSIGNQVQFRATGTTSVSNLATITGLQAGYAQSQYIQLIAGYGSLPSIDYMTSSANDSVTVSVIEWGAIPLAIYP